jgi:hypothetical protein
MYTGRPLPFESGGSVIVRGIDRTSSPADSVIAAEYSNRVQRIWTK